MSDNGKSLAMYCDSKKIKELEAENKELISIIESFERGKDIWLPKECLPGNVSEVEALHKLRSRYLPLIKKSG